MHCVLPGKHLGIIGSVGFQGPAAEPPREYSIEFRPRGAYVLYRSSAGCEVLPVDEGSDGRQLAHFCTDFGLDAALMARQLRRIAPDWASAFETADADEATTAR